MRLSIQPSSVGIDGGSVDAPRLCSTLPASSIFVSTIGCLSAAASILAMSVWVRGYLCVVKESVAELRAGEDCEGEGATVGIGGQDE